MRVVIAPDKFKGSLSAPEVCSHLEKGLQRGAGGNLDVVRIPVADGGEGTLDAAVGSGFTRRTATVSGPTGQPVEADYAVRGHEAVIEMAAASGLALVPSVQKGGRPTPVEAATASSLGTGQLIRAALDAGCRELIVGIGGSATNDAGAGMLQALGARLLDERGEDLKPGGASLVHLARIELSGFDSRLAGTRVRVACDVTNPLCGRAGASATYGPQKGATPEMVEELDAALSHFADVAEAATGKRVRDVPGAGAAGGLGAGLMAFLNGILEPGVKIVLEAVQLERRLAGARLAITGEGQVDWQTVYGKAPIGVAEAAKRQGIPAIAVCGSLGKGYREVFSHGLDAVLPIEDAPLSSEEAMAGAPRLIADATERALRLLLVGRRVSWN